MKRILLKLSIIVCIIVGVFDYIQGNSELIKNKEGLVRVAKITDKYKINITYSDGRDSTSYYIRSKFINKGLYEGVSFTQPLSKNKYDSKKVGEVYKVGVGHSVSLLEMNSKYSFFIIAMIILIIGISSIVLNYKDKFESYLVISVGFIILIISLIL